MASASLPQNEHRRFRLIGLAPATHTPFAPDGSLRLETVERQAAHLAGRGVRFAFVGGTTGECHSLTMEERRALALRWSEVIRGTSMRLIVHVGSNCLADARDLASHAETIGAAAIAAMAPSYFRPASLDVLIECCARIAEAAPATPFYFYDIPSMTGVGLPMPEFLERAPERIPTLGGLKFSNPDMAAFLRCLRAGEGRWDIAWGMDEWLLSALAAGARAMVGSSYNFAAPLYHRIIAAFEGGNLDEARALQERSARLIALLARYGYLPASRAVMTLLNVDVGPARLPLRNLTPQEVEGLRRELEALGFFEDMA